MASGNKKGILERLSEGVVLGDGGYLLELEKRGRVRAGPFTPEVALNNPESLLELHREFRDAGAEVLQALTFYASRDKLATVGMGERVEELNRAAVRIAKPPPTACAKPSTSNSTCKWPKALISSLAKHFRSSGKRCWPLNKRKKPNCQ
jgi:methionine synthase I (cobalamin-dependent)